jgi:hypothetical protein
VRPGSVLLWLLFNHCIEFFSIWLLIDCLFVCLFSEYQYSQSSGWDTCSWSLI